jgi:hypothetical protein
VDLDVSRSRLALHDVDQITSDHLFLLNFVA